MWYFNGRLLPFGLPDVFAWVSLCLVVRKRGLVLGSGGWRHLGSTVWKPRGKHSACLHGDSHIITPAKFSHNIRETPAAQNRERETSSYHRKSETKHTARRYRRTQILCAGRSGGSAFSPNLNLKHSLLKIWKSDAFFFSRHFFLFRFRKYFNCMPAHFLDVGGWNAGTGHQTASRPECTPRDRALDKSVENALLYAHKILLYMRLIYPLSEKSPTTFDNLRNSWSELTAWEGFQTMRHSKENHAKPFYIF